MHRPTVAQLRAARWALHARRVVWAQLKAGADVEDLSCPAAPVLGLAATRGVEVVLTRSEATCLLRSHVLQVWYAAHDVPRDLVIGVTAPSAGFRAHAWLEGPGELTRDDYREFRRFATPAGR